MAGSRETVGRLFSLLCAGLFALLSPAQAAQHECLPDFPLEDGWLGGDGVYSVPLSDMESLWLFGDSFVAAGDQETRRGAGLIANSVARSRCDSGAWSVAYHWHRDADAPRALFTPPDADDSGHGLRYWPLDGFVHEGVLTVFLMRVETVDPTDPLGFAVTGTDLARIGNPTTAPEQWHMRFHPLARVPALTGAGLVRTGDHIVLATPLEEPESRRHAVILTRLPLDGLDDPRDRIETLMPDGTWQRGLPVAEAAIVIPKATTEMSLDTDIRDTREGGWLAVHMDPAPFSGRIVVRTTSDLVGPWSAFRPLKTLETAKGNFCYAGKAHPQFQAPDGQSLTVTYACNSTDFMRLMDDLSLYVPHAVRVPLSETDGARTVP